MSHVPPGWYDHPSGGGVQRYWDGTAWADAASGPATDGGDGAPSVVGGSDAPIQIGLDDLDIDPAPVVVAPLVGGPSLTVQLDPDTAETPQYVETAGTPPAPVEGPSGRGRVVALVVVIVLALIGARFAAAMILGPDDDTSASPPRPGGGGSPSATTDTSPGPPATSSPATSPPATSPPATSPPATQAPSSGVEIGDSFSETCVVAWPSAPIRVSTSIQMQMSCPGVSSEFFLVLVVYPDPELEVTPSTGAMQVTGEVVDIAQSQAGFQELVVVADDIEF